MLELRPLCQASAKALPPARATKIDGNDYLKPNPAPALFLQIGLFNRCRKKISHGLGRFSRSPTLGNFPKIGAHPCRKPSRRATATLGLQMLADLTSHARAGRKEMQQFTQGTAQGRFTQRFASNALGMPNHQIFYRQQSLPWHTQGSRQHTSLYLQHAGLPWMLNPSGGQCAARQAPCAQSLITSLGENRFRRGIVAGTDHVQQFQEQVTRSPAKSSATSTKSATRPAIVAWARSVAIKSRAAASQSGSSRS